VARRRALPVGSRGAHTRARSRSTPRRTTCDKQEANWVWQFILVPEGDGTRLIVRSRYRTRQWLLEPVHFATERKMLLTIRRLSESGDARGPSAMPRVPYLAA